MRRTSGLACALMIGTLLTGLATPVKAGANPAKVEDFGDKDLLQSKYLARFLLGSASDRCGPHGEIVKVLNGKYQENRRALGLINEKAVLEVYISRKGTWTMLVTDPSGITCILAAGDAWDEAPMLAQGTGI